MSHVVLPGRFVSTFWPPPSWGLRAPRLALSARLCFFGPETAGAVTSWAEAKRWFNFGTLEAAENGKLTAGIVDTAGETRFSLELSPS